MVGNINENSCVPLPHEAAPGRRSDRTGSVDMIAMAPALGGGRSREEDPQQVLVVVRVRHILVDLARTWADHLKLGGQVCGDVDKQCVREQKRGFAMRLA